MRDVLIALAVACAMFNVNAPAAAQQDLRLTGQYPEAALEQGLGGTVGLECTVLDAERLDCLVMSEFPGGAGFAEAAVEMSHDWRPPLDTSGGVVAPGAVLYRAVRFVSGSEPSVRTSSGSPPGPWEQRPTAQDFARHFPEQALMSGISGLTILDCTVNVERRPDCQISAEAPTGHGFGRAALRISERFRAAPQTANGESTIGGRVRIPIRFNVRGR